MLEKADEKNFYGKSSEITLRTRVITRYFHFKHFCPSTLNMSEKRQPDCSASRTEAPGQVRGSGYKRSGLLLSAWCRALCGDCSQRQYLYYLKMKC
jgi:hypothetical protein